MLTAVAQMFDYVGKKLVRREFKLPDNFIPILFKELKLKEKKKKENLPQIHPTASP